MDSRPPNEPCRRGLRNRTAFFRLLRLEFANLQIDRYQQSKPPVLRERNFEVRLIEQRLLEGFVLNLMDQDILGPAEPPDPLKVELALGGVLSLLPYH
jgi:hypothetical protein